MTKTFALDPVDAAPADVAAKPRPASVYPRERKPVLAALIDAAASAMKFFLPGKTDVRHGDYHLILRKL